MVKQDYFFEFLSGPGIILVQDRHRGARPPMLQVLNASVKLRYILLGIWTMKVVETLPRIVIEWKEKTLGNFNIITQQRLR